MHNKSKTNTEPPQTMGRTLNNRSTTSEQFSVFKHCIYASLVDYPFLLFESADTTTQWHVQLVKTLINLAIRLV